MNVFIANGFEPWRMLVVCLAVGYLAFQGSCLAIHNTCVRILNSRWAKGDSDYDTSMRSGFGSANGNRTRILALKGLRANRCTIAPPSNNLTLRRPVQQLGSGVRRDACP